MQTVHTQEDEEDNLFLFGAYYYYFTSIAAQTDGLFVECEKEEKERETFGSPCCSLLMLMLMWALALLTFLSFKC